MNFWKGKGWKGGLITKNMISGTWVEYPRTRTFNGLRDTCCLKTWYRWGLSLVAGFLGFKFQILLILLIRESRLCFLLSRDLCDLVGKPMQRIPILLGVTHPLAIGAMRTSTPSIAISSIVAAASLPWDATMADLSTPSAGFSSFNKWGTRRSLVMREFIDGTWSPASTWSRTWSKSECRTCQVSCSLFPMNQLQGTFSALLR